jgi:hypothetical protein
VLTTRPALYALTALCLLTSVPFSRVSRSTASEAEPNDAFSSATLVVMGDTVSGVVSSGADVDYFAINVQLSDSVNGLWEVWAPRDTDVIDYPITAPGRYFIRVTPYEGGGPNHVYTLAFRAAPIELGAGDPTTIVGHVHAPLGAAAAPGAFYLSDGSRLLRLTTAGVDSFAPLPWPEQLTGGIALDGHGDVLAPGSDATRSVVYRIPAGGGHRSIFAVFGPARTDISNITVGADGHVWVAQSGLDLNAAGTHYVSTSQIRRLNPLGDVLDLIDVTALGPVRGLAISPHGVLHFSADAGIYSLLGRTPMLAAPAPGVTTLAFDADGFLYAGASGRVLLFDPSCSMRTDPFAHVPGVPAFLVFARDAGGAVTSQLLVTESFPARILKMNAGGMRAPGQRVGGDLERVAHTGAGSATAGADYADTLRLGQSLGGVQWRVVSGVLPPGVTLTSSTGVVSGALREAGDFTFAVHGTNGTQSGYARFTVSVEAPEISVAQATTALLDPAAAGMDAATRRFLDMRGNDNGILDVGDIRSYLRRQGELR